MRYAFLAIVLAACVARAQAPVEDRSVRSNPVAESQQRLAELRRVLDRAVNAASEAQREADAADLAEQSARKQLEDARGRRATAVRQLERSGQEVLRAQTAFDREAAELERRRAGGIPGGR